MQTIFIQLNVLSIFLQFLSKGFLFLKMQHLQNYSTWETSLTHTATVK